MSDQRKWEDIEAEFARLVEFHDNIENLYHDTISKHESTISIHEVGDLLLKCGTLKEVSIIE
jgi:hypothetical protein